MSVRALVVVLQMTRSLPPPPAPLPAPCCHFHHLLARGRHRPRGSPSETSGLAWCPRIVKVTGSSLAGRSRHLTTSSIRLKPGRRHYHREINDSYLTGVVRCFIDAKRVVFGSQSGWAGGIRGNFMQTRTHVRKVNIKSTPGPGFRFTG